MRLLLQTGGWWCGSILTSSETTARANSLQTSQLFVGLKLPTSICFGIYLLPNYGTRNTVMISSRKISIFAKYIRWNFVTGQNKVFSYFWGRVFPRDKGYQKKLWTLKTRTKMSAWSLVPICLFEPKHKVHKVNCCIFNRFVNNSNFLRKLFLMRFPQVCQEQQNPISFFLRILPFLSCGNFTVHLCLGIFVFAKSPSSLQGAQFILWVPDSFDQFCCLLNSKCCCLFNREHQAKERAYGTKTLKFKRERSNSNSPA